MCNWRAWLLPCFLTLLIITALAVMVRGGPIEADLTARSGDIFSEDGTPWAAAQLDGRDSYLSGVAPTEAAFVAAIAAANRVPGVYVVDASALTLVPLAEPYTLGFNKAGNSVTVTGTFPNVESRTSVLDSVRTTLPDVDIVDETSLARGAPEGFARFAAFAGNGLAALSNGTVALDGSTLSISADAITLNAYDEELARLDAPVDGLSIGSIAFNAPIVSPYTWAASTAGQGLTITGFVPDDAARAAILAAAEPMGPITDAMVTGPGAPDGFTAAATALLGQMVGLEDAGASINDLELSLSGAAPSSDVFDATSTFMGSIPAGFDSLSGRILPPLAEPFVTSLSKGDDGYTLAGVLPDETARAVILDALEAQGQGVRDATTIARGAPASVDIGDLFAGAFGTLQDLVQGTATLSDAQFSVVGTSASFAGASTAEQAINALETPSLTVDTDIAPGPASPFTFSVDATDEGITLDGFVPSEALREQVLAAVALQFPTHAISDNLIVADGAPLGFDAMMQAGIRGLGRLRDGALSVSDNAARLTGDALYQRSINRVQAAVESALPPAFTLTTDISALGPPEQVDAEACQLLFARLLADNTIRFNTGSAEIDTVSFGLLDRLVRTLLSCPDARVEIGGHTDSQGSDTSNLTLSEARAQAVYDYVDDAGIARSRIIAVGYGESDPIATNDTEEGRAQNRRIEFTVQR
jgi:outer membrane protein OmpA-like peptidoglycan-associated protein